MNVFITGVSSGIGHALAVEYLAAGHHVFGMSRRTPDDLCERPQFHFAPFDLHHHDEISSVAADLLGNVDSIDIAILNAGILGSFGDMAEAEIVEMKRVMEINLWSCKSVLDAVFSLGTPVRQIVTMSSGAAVNGNRGWRGYAISKAALNMLTMLYAAERTDTHFCLALAPGLVDTAMQDQLAAVPASEAFSSLDVIRSKRNSSDMPSPEVVASKLVKTIAHLPILFESGDFADIRKPPISAELA